MNINFNELLDTALTYTSEYAPSLLGAIITLILGLWMAKKLTNIISKIMEKRGVDASLRPFLISLLSTILKILIIISVMGMVGIEMTSFIAILGAAGLAVGMALSGTLQNFAGGVMLLIFKPFKVGDFIDAQGHTGTVKEIQIFNTILNTPDNKIIIIPNGGLSTNSMTNYSALEDRRVDFIFGIGYGDDLEKAKEIVMNIAKADDRIFSDPEPFVRMGEMGNSSVNITARFWANSANYWDLHFDIMEEVYKQFNTHNISIPYPQMDIHLDK